MKLKVFSVYDSKAEAFMQPFFVSTVGMAARMFEEACLDEKHNFHRHAGDYTLFEIGEFDDSTGRVDCLPTPRSLGMALEVVSRVQQMQKRQEIDL